MFVKRIFNSFDHKINFQFVDEMFAKTRTAKRQVTPRIPRLIFTVYFHTDFIRTDLREEKQCCFGSRSLRTFGVSP